MGPDVLGAPLRPEVPPDFVGGGNRKAARPAVERRERLTRAIRYGNSLAGDERHAVVPQARLVGRQVRAPHVAGFGPGLASAAVGGEVARHDELRLAGLVLKGNREAIVGERIRRSVHLVRKRAREVERDLVPLAEHAGDRRAAVAVGGVPGGRSVR